MLKIDNNGYIIDNKIINKISPMIEHDAMPFPIGIIVHQTGGSTATSTLNSYQLKGADGAHFLIDKMGIIYQTASIYKSTNHVGKLKSRCAAENTCSDAEKKLNAKYNPKKEHEREKKKSFPDRYPSNLDSIGIELVGESVALDPKKPKDKTYVKVTTRQNESLKWLVEQLEMALCIFGNVVFRHPDVSRKNLTEASTAKWD
jgi:N-acetyl-anhydromuramyl-L-alanine amidase AmpD